MGRNDRFLYIVEGECEKKLITTFKEQKDIIVSGKVQTFNVVQELLTNMHIRTIKDNTIVILVFDTDTNNIEIVNENIKFLKKARNIKDVWLVLQVKNLEDELVRATNVTQIKNLIGSKSNKDYKHDFIHEKNLYDKLKCHNFEINKLWITSPMGVFKLFKNQGAKVKIVSK